MSIFSSSVKSQIIDPVFHSENRCEFRLANRGEAYLPTLRLGNIGLTKDAGNNNTYHFGAGAASVISRIRLMDGNEELERSSPVAPADQPIEPPSRLDITLTFSEFVF